MGGCAGSYGHALLATSGNGSRQSSRTAPAMKHFGLVALVGIGKPACTVPSAPLQARLGNSYLTRRPSRMPGSHNTQRSRASSLL
jgi:hypothetical protein